MYSQADRPPAGPQPSLVVERHRVRRPLGGLFWAGSFVAVAGLVLLTSAVTATNVEDALGQAATTHLAGAGMKGVGVEVDGLNVTAEVPIGRDTHGVEDELATVPGVGMVSSVEVYRSKAEQRACTRLTLDLARVTNKQQIPFVGETAQLTPTGSQMLVEAARLLEACPGATVVVGGHADPHTDGYGTLSLVRARVMAQALKRQGIASGRLVPRGYGDEFTIADGDSPAAQQRNQRGSLVVQEN